MEHDNESKKAYLWIITHFTNKIENSPYLIEWFVDNYDQQSSQVRIQLLSSCVMTFLFRPAEIHPILEQLFKIAFKDKDISVIESAIWHQKLLIIYSKDYLSNKIHWTNLLTQIDSNSKKVIDNSIITTEKSLLQLKENKITFPNFLIRLQGIPKDIYFQFIQKVLSTSLINYFNTINLLLLSIQNENSP